MNETMRRCSVILVGGLWLLVAPAVLRGAEAPLAKVNGDAVMGRELLTQFNSRHSGHSRFLGGDAEARKFLDVVIDDRLLIQEAYSLGLDEGAEVAKYIDDYERSKLAEWFVAQEINGKASVTPEEIRTIRDNSLSVILHARQILLSSRREAEEVRAAVLAGADFETLARGCSLAESRLRGGHVMSSWGTFEPAWESVVFATEPGAVAPVIETSDGFEVVYVINRVDVDPPKLEAVSKEIEDALFARKLQTRKKEITDQLWLEYHVVLNIGGFSPALLTRLLVTSPDMVVATWEGGRLTLRETFEKGDLERFSTLDPLKAKKELDERIRQTVNAPLVVLEARKRKMNEVPAVRDDVDRYRDYVVESMLFRDHVFRNLELSPADVEAYYLAHVKEFEVPEQRRVAQILVSTEAEAKKIRLKLDATSDFAAVAKKSSRDMVSAAAGGELGWIAAGDVQSGFKEVLALKVGGISKPMQSKAGWHIIKLHETKPPRVPPLAEVQAKVAERALDGKKREARALWVGRLRAAGKVEIDSAAIAAFVKANESTGKPPPQHVVQ